MIVFQAQGDQWLTSGRSVLWRPFCKTIFKKSDLSWGESAERDVDAAERDVWLQSSGLPASASGTCVGTLDNVSFLNYCRAILGTGDHHALLAIPWSTQIQMKTLRCREEQKIYKKMKKPKQGVEKASIAVRTWRDHSPCVNSSKSGFVLTLRIRVILDSRLAWTALLAPTKKKFRRRRRNFFPIQKNSRGLSMSGQHRALKFL